MNKHYIPPTTTSYLCPGVVCLLTVPGPAEAKARRATGLDILGEPKVSGGTGGALLAHGLGLAGADSGTVTLAHTVPGEENRIIMLQQLVAHLQAAGFVPATSQLQVRQLGKL